MCQNGATGIGYIDRIEREVVNSEVELISR